MGILDTPIPMEICLCFWNNDFDGSRFVPPSI